MEQTVQSTQAVQSGLKNGIFHGECPNLRKESLFFPRFHGFYPLHVFYPFYTICTNICTNPGA